MSEGVRSFYRRYFPALIITTRGVHLDFRQGSTQFSDIILHSLDFALEGFIGCHETIDEFLMRFTSLFVPRCLHSFFRVIATLNQDAVYSTDPSAKENQNLHLASSLYTNYKGLLRYHRISPSCIIQHHTISVSNQESTGTAAPRATSTASPRRFPRSPR